MTNKRVLESDLQIAIQRKISMIMKDITSPKKGIVEKKAACIRQLERLREMSVSNDNDVLIVKECQKRLLEYLGRLDPKLKNAVSCIRGSLL